MSPKQAAACCRPVDDLLDPELFKALCDPTRAKLVACVCKCSRPCGVGEIAECCDVDLSVVSRHLQMLERAGVLSSERRGRTVFYALRYEHVVGVLRGLADAIAQCAPGCGGGCGEGACCGK